MKKRVGKATIEFSEPVNIIGCGSIAGPMEAKGPWGNKYDLTLDDDLWAEESWEKAESKMFYEAARTAINKTGLETADIHYLLGGDLLNQIIAASFAARALNIPFIGLYGACSTMAESLCMGAMLIDGGFAEQAVCCATSHFSTAERQFRFPLEMGAQRTPTAQRTVTGAGATVLSSKKKGKANITRATIGRVVDFGITDANNMGAAMAPAACDTILQHLHDTKTMPSDYDAIYTGDLGTFGLEILNDLMQKSGVPANSVLHDCGAEIYGSDQDVHAGGSGCGCCGITLNARLIPDIEQGKLSKILVVATGALLSSVSTMQGESIPGIAHAICIERAV